MKMFIVILLFLLAACSSQQDVILNVQFKPVSVYQLSMPIKETSFTYPRIIQIKDSFIVVYFYPIDTLYVYQIKKKNTTKLSLKIPINFYSLHGLEIINLDSIWLFGGTSTLKDHRFQLINSKGQILKDVNLHQVIQDKEYRKDYFQVYENKFLYDNKLFFTIYFYDKDGHNSHYQKHPIIGYYDLVSDKIVLNQSIYFPYINDSIFYSVNDHAIRYCPFFTINQESGEIIISFSFTRTFYVWDFKSNQVRTFHTANSLLMDTILPFNRPISGYDPEFKKYGSKVGMYYGLSYLKGQKLYCRFAALPTGKIDAYNGAYVFLDEHKNYIGEVLADSLKINNQRFYFLENDNDSLILVYSSTNNVLNIYLGKLYFLKVNKEEYIKHYKQNLKQIEENEEVEVCRIIGKSENITKTDILPYLRNKHGITDSSFSVLILHAGGCPSCNKYFLNNFLLYNKEVFFNLKRNPFYLLYVDANSTFSYVKNEVLKEYMDYPNRVKIDTAYMYDKYFNYVVQNNPRLMLVRSNQIICDTTYMPNELEKLAFKLIEFYNMKTQ